MQFFRNCQAVCYERTAFSILYKKFKFQGDDTPLERRVILRGIFKEAPMDQIKRNLYELLFSCKGNWRNAIYVPCGPCPHPCKVDRSGCLAAIRQDGAPLLVGVREFEEETGERIDPGECIGTLNKDAFSSLFSRYLTWEMSSSEQCPMEYLTDSSPCTLVPKYQKQKGDLV